jgi:DNA-binding transcriptional regulator YiaG
MANSNNGITREDVKAARASAGLTQAAAARLISNSIDNWQNWEQGRNSMRLGLYELFLLKTGKLAVGKSLTDAEKSVPQFRARIR